MDTVTTALEALGEGRWQAAGERMVAKMLSEFLYEQLLVAEPAPGGGDTAWRATAGAAVYEFTGRTRLYERLRVQRASVRRDGAPAADPVRLLLDLAPALAMEPATTAHLARELRATQLADCHIAASPRRSAAELVELPWAEIEGEMDGHPWLVPNKGRIGFGHEDHLRFAPERRRPLPLRWLAVREGRGEYRAVAGLDHLALRRLELDGDVRERFAAVLRARREDPDRFLWFPVHPWQWDHVVLPLFAADLASGDLVELGEAGDLHLPQQSIRTLSNVGTPRRHSVKLPLSILNTLVYRGLPTDRTLAAPAVTELLQGIAATDPFLRDRCRLILLGEVAGVAGPTHLRGARGGAVSVPRAARLHLARGARGTARPRRAGDDDGGAAPRRRPGHRGGERARRALRARRRGLARRPARRGAAAAAPLPLPPRGRLLSARRERHPGAPRRGPRAGWRSRTSSTTSTSATSRCPSSPGSPPSSARCSSRSRRSGSASSSGRGSSSATCGISPT